MTPKPWYRSLTFWSLVATLLGLVLAGIGQGDPLLAILGDTSVQATVGEILAFLGLGGVLVGRARAVGPLTLGDGDRSGHAGLGVLAFVVLGAVFAAALISAGCIPRQVVAKDSIEILVVEDDESCVVELRADGKLASRLTGPRCDDSFGGPR